MKEEIKNIETFRELLLEHIPSKEIKQRMSNKQIKINNEVIKNFEVEMNLDYNDVIDLGTFHTTLDMNVLNKINLGKSVGIDFKDFFGVHDYQNTNGDSPKYLHVFRDYTLLTISKNEHFVLKFKD